MSSKPRIVRKQQFAIKDWVSDYNLPDIEEALEDGRINQIKKAMLTEFASIAEESLMEDGHLHFLGNQPGEVTFSLSESSLTPNRLEFIRTVEDMVEDLMCWLGKEEIESDPRDFEPDNIRDLEQWRDEFLRAAQQIDDVIKKCQR